MYVCVEVHSRASNDSNVNKNVQSYILVPGKDPFKRDITIIEVYIYIYIHECMCVWRCIAVDLTIVTLVEMFKVIYWFQAGNL